MATYAIQQRSHPAASSGHPRACVRCGTGLWVGAAFALLIQPSTYLTARASASTRTRYWAAWRHDGLYTLAPQQLDAYLYSPAFAEADLAAGTALRGRSSASSGRRSSPASTSGCSLPSSFGGGSRCSSCAASTWSPATSGPSSHSSWSSGCAYPGSGRSGVDEVTPLVGPVLGSSPVANGDRWR